MVGALVGLGLSSALACGPYFPAALLDDRAGTLRAPPTDSFAFEARRLVTASDDLKPVESGDPYWYLSGAELDEKVQEQLRKARAAAETPGLTAPQIRALVAMRQATTGDAALDGADILPPAVRLYTAGAVDFAHDRPADAARRFDAVLALPDEARGARAVWAAFMLGRIDNLDGRLDDAAKAFELARRLARAGLPDPLGLAVASYGEQARAHVEAARGLAPDDPAAARETAAAVALYAEQAARGSDSGVQSLRMVAELVLADGARVASAARDPLTLRLLVAYALANGNTNLTTLVQAIEAIGGPPAVDVGRLAALAYTSGRYDLAARLATAATSPMALWIRAKLALRNGDLAAAAGFYAEAETSIPDASAPPLDDDHARLLIGEGGTLALARGEPIEALRLLYRAGSWPDAARVADRVLTTDELKRFVDQTAPTVEARPVSPAPADDASGEPAKPPAQRLRDLLARRLVRDGRFAEAPRYFSDPQIATQAVAYGQALDQAHRRWSRIGRAEAWFAAASLARDWGMELIGFEGDPDYAFWGGTYYFWSGQQEPDDGPLVTPDERTRVAASRAVPERRYHYRYVAVDQVLRSAALLPPRSQAFAAVLCRAADWMRHTPGEDATVAALYRIYVTRGPYVAWANHFGIDCPDPDFDGAARLLWTRPVAEARHAVRAHLMGAGSALVVVLALGGGWYGWRRCAAAR